MPSFLCWWRYPFCIFPEHSITFLHPLVESHKLEVPPGSIKTMIACPGWVAQLLEHRLVYQKVAGSIPGQGTYGRQLINVVFFITLVFLPSSLSQIIKRILGWGFFLKNHDSLAQIFLYFMDNQTAVHRLYLPLHPYPGFWGFFFFSHPNTGELFKRCFEWKKCCTYNLFSVFHPRSQVKIVSIFLFFYLVLIWLKSIKGLVLKDHN